MTADRQLSRIEAAAGHLPAAAFSLRVKLSATYGE